MLTRMDVNMLVTYHTMTSDALRSLTSEQHAAYMAWQNALPVVGEWYWDGAGDYVSHVELTPCLLMNDHTNELTAVLHTYVLRITPEYTANYSPRMRDLLGHVRHNDVREEPAWACMNHGWVWQKPAILHHCKQELATRIEQWELGK